MGQWPQQVHCGVGVIVGVGVLCCRRAHSWFQGAAPGTGVVVMDWTVQTAGACRPSSSTIQMISGDFPTASPFKAIAISLISKISVFISSPA